MNTYDVGDLVTMTATFAAIGGAAVNPDEVVFLIKPPSGPTITAGSILNPVTGTFTCRQACTQAGLWTYWCEGSGGYQAAGYNTFNVRAKPV